MENVLGQRLSPSPIKIFLYQLHKIGGNTDSLSAPPLKCTTPAETLLMHRTTFYCLSLVQGQAENRENLSYYHALGGRPFRNYPPGNIIKKVKSLQSTHIVSSLIHHKTMKKNIKNKEK